ncbi:MAG: hypothetical protein JWO54_839 [Candidatus Saccharibacteria bacterium]|nr:hypothetical protein [Candidatus Saccharibacteria bacterium]
MDENLLKDMYVHKVMSMQEIAKQLGFSVHKINFWLTKYSISKRTHSEASYVKYNGLVDPFEIKSFLSPQEERLFGMGVGIYWGEGNKKNINTVRVGNTDAKLIKVFIDFLIIICGVKPNKIRYGLQVFTDVEENVALHYWLNELNITRNQIMPTISRINSGKIGTYKIKNQFGVMTVYVFNRKLRDWLVDQLFVPR